jgi:hypothetical protein
LCCCPSYALFDPFVTTSGERKREGGTATGTQTSQRRGDDDFDRMIMLEVISDG